MIWSFTFTKAVAEKYFIKQVVLKKEKPTQCFPVLFVKFLAFYFIEHLWWLLLDLHYGSANISLFTKELMLVYVKISNCKQFKGFYPSFVSNIK